MRSTTRSIHAAAEPQRQGGTTVKVAYILYAALAGNPPDQVITL